MQQLGKCAETFLHRYENSFLSEVAPEDFSEVAEAFAWMVARAEADGCDYIDSFRVTDARDPHGHYMKRTCCGSHDEIYRCWSGKAYLMGFNYGH